ncbi:hypothetical protein CTAYLR_010325 [Chrysophaeum taylorii]|uniref:Uncharacterized protein n=1 Tax=Chrysophaeum taylorii TaxID=2483200 RepID=A0AAD7UH93_9STRA|nr:hypothetical protein CTAYLR_010325 [Chrysophaeum taylorii]
MGWAQPDPDKIEDAEEDIHNREEQLEAELEYTKTRCEELRKTLQDTKSYIARTAGGNTEALAAATGDESRQSSGHRPPKRPGATLNGDADDDDDCLYEEDEEDEESVESVAPISRRGGAASAVAETPRTRPSKIEVPSSKATRERVDLVDTPSSASRLAERIQIIRHRCVNALGAKAFQQAHEYLKSLQAADDAEIAADGFAAVGGVGGRDSDQHAKEKLRAILGAENLHFASLIDQLIFMEDSL